MLPFFVDSNKSSLHSAGNDDCKSEKYNLAIIAYFTAGRDEDSVAIFLLRSSVIS
jgi:hypothetical protein